MLIILSFVYNLFCKGVDNICILSVDVYCLLVSVMDLDMKKALSFLAVLDFHLPPN